MAWWNAGLWGLLGATLLLLLDESRRMHAEWEQERNLTADPAQPAPQFADLFTSYGNPKFLFGTVGRLFGAGGVTAALAAGDVICSVWTALAVGAAAPAFLMDGILATLWPPMKEKR